MAAKKGLTKVLTESGVISTVNATARIRAITLSSGTTASSIIINDGGSGGTAKWKLALIATTGAGDQSHSVSFGDKGFICITDAYGTLAGTGAIASILYDEME